MEPGVILFDCYLTLVDIHTDEEDPAVWVQVAAAVADAGGPHLPGPGLRRRYTGLVCEQLAASGEPYPEVDVVGVFREIVGPDLAALAGRRLRAASTRRFAVFPDVLPTLRALRATHRLGLVTDAQRLFLEPELRAAGLEELFDVVVVSGDLGYRKPDPRMFAAALAALGARPEEAVHVGDSLARDVGGAQAAGVAGVWLDRGLRAGGVATAGVTPDAVIRSLRELTAGSRRGPSRSAPPTASSP